MASRTGGSAAAVLRGVLVSFLLAIFLSADSRADGLSGYLEYVYTKTTSESKDATGTESTLDTGNFLQRYNLSLDKRVYPNLRLLSGGLFEKSDVSGSTETGTTRQDFDSTTTKLRPFVDLSLSTPLYQMAANYSRSEDRQKSQGSPPLTLIRDQYSGMLGWNPEALPSLRFQFLRADRHDGERIFQDSSSQSYQLTSQYRPVSSVSLYYQGGLTDSQDRLSNNESRDVVHNGRFSYAGQWWNRRISLGTDYNITYRETEFHAGGAGEVSVPLLPFSGLSAIDDTPELGELSVNPSLVDGDLQAGSGINLGLPPPGGDTQRRNVGLDFGVPTAVNTLFVSIDREIPRSVGDSFSWDIYTSSDNLNWILFQTIQPALQDPFVPRFEIRLQDVTARYIKAVTRPLASTVPLATDFPLIQVTELQAALRSSAAAAGGRAVSASHIYNLSVRTRILDVPTLTYELAYSFAKATRAPSRFHLSNGLYAGHRFSKHVSGTARVAREDSEDSGRGGRAYVFSGSLEAVPLPTLRHNLLLGARDDSAEGRSSRNLSLLLYNTAGLYKGLDVNVAAGRSRSVSETGQRTDTTQADASAVIVPNRKVTLNLTYAGKWDKITGGDPPADRTVTTHSKEASVVFTPVSTVYLFGSYRAENPSGQNRRTIRNYSASWTPFPDGKLHLGFLYSETLRSETDGRDRTINPNLRLDIARGSFFSLAYQNTSSRSNLQSSDSDIISGDLRIAF